ncbi:GNAT family N-acetyltransferase [Nonomuraea sp. KC401]|uniref:GNAT family N-acetyltransferase n=1 Tax=unclassified Nonomuraea TaxID=2593643 RepID=UPI0010FD6736|nr:MULTISPECIES: GNAT family N-acetyltransferase [unclassified Nonomuraea]NBE91962.1 GNAT family N-acetyltransferase [Nonomuraea sp. K271]TLF71778.1 GNAT family N-acetyltransferase [Nonomuraea sp. KC401]
MQWEPLTREDARPLAELWAAIEAEDMTGAVYGVDDVAERLGSRLLDLTEGTLAARDGDRIVAFGCLPARQSAGETHLMHLWGGVHPAHRRRGLGRRVIDWSLRAAPRVSAKPYPGLPVEITFDVYDDLPGTRALAEGAGFTAARYFARMERSLTGDLPPVRPPEGVSIATWSPELDDGVRHVRNEAFRDHWGSVPHTPESWRHSITGSRNFVPEATFVALAGERPVGGLVTHFFDRKYALTGERQAWIQIVATLKEWRGRGVAGTLIAHALSAFAQQGYTSTGLGVDAHNPTGAVSVYTGSGFAVTRRCTSYLRSLPAASQESGEISR